MPKQAKLYHKCAEQLAKIRQTNVQRHAGYENALKLRQNIVINITNIASENNINKADLIAVLQSGAFQGPPGDKGDKGDKGDTGDKGDKNTVEKRPG